MKKQLAIIYSAVFMLLLLAGCGSKTERILYQTDLSKAVKLGDYKGLALDGNSDEWKKEYASEIESDVESNGFYTEIKKTQGTVENGDTVNIDYEGKRDGVAFEGGTAQGYDLEIGSHSFIDGFEEGLIGKEIGSTVDLNLSFPDPYPNNPDLAGVPVVFTVTVNYAVTNQAQQPAEYFEKLGFDSEKAYREDVRERTIQNLLINLATESAEIKEYPQQEVDLLYTSYKNRVEQNLQNSYGVDFATYLSSVGKDEKTFKEELIENTIKPEMKKQMVLYRILDREKLPLTEQKVQEQIDHMLDMYGKDTQITAQKLTDYFGKYYFEVLAVTDIVGDFLKENAVVSS